MTRIGRGPEQEPNCRNPPEDMAALRYTRDRDIETIRHIVS